MREGTTANVSRKRGAAPRARAHAHKNQAAPKSKGPKASPRTRATDDHSHRPRILSALDAAPAGMSHADLIRALDVNPAEDARLGIALVALRRSKAITRVGAGEQAVYRRAKP